MKTQRDIDALYRLGGEVPSVEWLTSLRGSPLHPKITHAFVRGLSECENSWADEALPSRFAWPPPRVCDACMSSVLKIWEASLA